MQRRCLTVYRYAEDLRLQEVGAALSEVEGKGRFACGGSACTSTLSSSTASSSWRRAITRCASMDFRVNPRRCSPSHTRGSSSSATPVWAAVQSRRRVSKPATTSWARSRRNVESDGDLPKSVPRSSLSVWRWRLAKPHHWGKRMLGAPDPATT